MRKNYISIIIRTWNRVSDLSDTLRQLKRITYEQLEIIVVDNGSTDNTALTIRALFPYVKVIGLDKNIGVEATNIGIRNSDSEYLIILDDDAFLMPDVIEESIKKFKEHSRLGILAFKIIDFFSGLSPQTHYEHKRKYLMQDDGIPVKVFQGGGFMMLKHVFDTVGGYPEDFFWVGEESDLAFRVLVAGWEIRYFPDLIVTHKPSRMNRTANEKPYYEIRNVIWIYWRYSPIILASIKTLFSIASLFVKAVRNNAMPHYLYGVKDGLCGLPRQMKKRRVVYTQTMSFMLNSIIKKTGPY